MAITTTTAQKEIESENPFMRTKKKFNAEINKSATMNGCHSWDAVHVCCCQLKLTNELKLKHLSCVEKFINLTAFENKTKFEQKENNCWWWERQKAKKRVENGKHFWYLNMTPLLRVVFVRFHFDFYRYLVAPIFWHIYLSVSFIAS